MFSKKLAMLVPRTSKGTIPHVDILGQGVIKGRQKFRFVATGGVFQLQPFLRVPADYRRNADRRADGFIRKHKHRQVKTGAFKQRQNTATAVGSGNDDCGHIGKVGTVQRHYVSVGG